MAYSTDQDEETPSHHAEWWDEMNLEGGRRTQKRKAGRAANMNSPRASTAERQRIIEETNDRHRVKERRFAREVKKAHRGEGSVAEVDEPPAVIGGFWAI